MDCVKFMSWNFMVLLAAIIIYTGCHRSYSIYFFERDAKKVIFLEETSAVAIPMILSILLIILHHNLKPTKNNDMEEKTAEQKLPQSRTSSISCHLTEKIPEKLGSISESTVADRNEEVSGNFGEAASADGAHQESPSCRAASLRRESSILSNHELAIERKRSEIYKKIGKVSFWPSMDEVVTDLRCSSVNMSKQSVLDILSRLIIIHAPIWLGVIAVQITVVEILDNKFYHLFYYHHPRIKQMATIIAILLGLFHEVKWTWIINDILGIATSYVVIARTETASYFAGFLFLLGMILFDIFWSYCVDFFPVVTEYPHSSVMLIIPLGKKRRPTRISIVDIMVPGIFLNIILKFSEMYDNGVFILSFYACIFGLLITELIILFRQKTTPAIVIPGIFAIVVSMLSVDNPSDLWRFGIKH